MPIDGVTRESNVHGGYIRGKCTGMYFAISDVKKRSTRKHFPINYPLPGEIKQRSGLINKHGPGPLIGRKKIGPARL